MSAHVSLPVALALFALVIGLGCAMVVQNAFNSALGSSLGEWRARVFARQRRGRGLLAARRAVDAHCILLFSICYALSSPRAAL